MRRGHSVNEGVRAGVAVPQDGLQAQSQPGLAARAVHAGRGAAE